MASYRYLTPPLHEQSSDGTIKLQYDHLYDTPDRSCILCKTAGQPYTSHHLLDCPYLPDDDRNDLLYGVRYDDNDSVSESDDMFCDNISQSDIYDPSGELCGIQSDCDSTEYEPDEELQYIDQSRSSDHCYMYQDEKATITIIPERLMSRYFTSCSPMNCNVQSDHVPFVTDISDNEYIAIDEDCVSDSNDSVNEYIDEDCVTDENKCIDGDCVVPHAEVTSVRQSWTGHFATKIYQQNQMECIDMNMVKVSARAHTGETHSEPVQQELQYETNGIKHKLEIHTGEALHKSVQQTPEYEHVDIRKVTMRTHTSETPYGSVLHKQVCDTDSITEDSVGTHKSVTPHVFVQPKQQCDTATVIKDSSETHTGDAPPKPVQQEERYDTVAIINNILDLNETPPMYVQPKLYCHATNMVKDKPGLQSGEVPYMCVQQDLECDDMNIREQGVGTHIGDTPYTAAFQKHKCQTVDLITHNVGSHKSRFINVHVQHKPVLGDTNIVQDSEETHTGEMYLVSMIDSERTHTGEVSYTTIHQEHGCDTVDTTKDGKGHTGETPLYTSMQQEDQPYTADMSNCSEERHTGQTLYSPTQSKIECGDVDITKDREGTHTGEIPYAPLQRQLQCGMDSITKDNVGIHVHPGEKPYTPVKQEQECDTVGNLVTGSVEIHTGDELADAYMQHKLECDSSGSMNKEKERIETHTEERPYLTVMCKSGYNKLSGSTYILEPHTEKASLSGNINTSTVAGFHSKELNVATHKEEKPHVISNLINNISSCCCSTVLHTRVNPLSLCAMLTTYEIKNMRSHDTEEKLSEIINMQGDDPGEKTFEKFSMQSHLTGEKSSQKNSMHSHGTAEKPCDIHSMQSHITGDNLSDITSMQNHDTDERSYEIVSMLSHNQEEKPPESSYGAAEKLFQINSMPSHNMAEKPSNINSIQSPHTEVPSMQKGRGEKPSHFSCIQHSTRQILMDTFSMQGHTNVKPSYFTSMQRDMGKQLSDELPGINCLLSLPERRICVKPQVPAAPVRPPDFVLHACISGHYQASIKTLMSYDVYMSHHPEIHAYMSS